MGTEYDLDFLRGVGVLFDWHATDNLWAAEATYTQAGEVPGLARFDEDNADTSSSRTALAVSGVQAPGQELRIAAHDGGWPGQERSQPSSMTYNDTADAAASSSSKRG